MGRRALPKVDPKIDLSRHFRTFDELPPTWDAAALFGRTAPLQIEVGSGKGLFLRTAGRAEPEKNFLGIEIAQKYARYAAAKAAAAGCDNVVVVAGDAQRVFAERLAAGIAEAVHVYFPDPWWKKRHHKRRIMNPNFLSVAHRVLHAGGRLVFWTDVEAYYVATLELLATLSDQWRGPCEAPADFAAGEYRTHFDRRMRLHDHDVFQAEWEKRPAE